MSARSGESDFVTFATGEQLFGLAIGEVHDVFRPQRITPVPLAPPEIAGVLAMRGRVVTAIDLRRRLGMPPRAAAAPAMALGIADDGDTYGLIVDTMGEVMRLNAERIEPVPVNLDRRWAHVAAGVCRLDDALLVIVSVRQIIAIEVAAAA